MAEEGRHPRYTPPTGPLTEAPGDHTPSARRAALLSVYYHTYDRGGAARMLLPAQLRPLRLEDAVPAIHEDDRRLALAKLVAAGGLENRHGLYPLTSRLLATVHGLNAANEETLTELVSTTRDAVAAELTRSIPKKFTPCNVGVLLDSRGYSTAVHNVLSNNVLGGPACSQKNADTDVDFDVNTLVSTATTTIEVQRHFADLAKIMDPRGWRELGPDYFAHSYKAKEVNGTVQYKDDGNPEPDVGTTAPIGTDWSGVLFEQFEWNWNDLSLSQFRNLLRIKFEVDHTQGAEHLHLEYSLIQCLDSMVGYDEQDGGLDVDSGFADVIGIGGSAPPTWQVTAQKKLRFTDRTPGNVGLEVPVDLGMALNFLAPAMIGIFLDRSVSLAVCQPPPTGVL